MFHWRWRSSEWSCGRRAVQQRVPEEASSPHTGPLRSRRIVRNARVTPAIRFACAQAANSRAREQPTLIRDFLYKTYRKAVGFVQEIGSTERKGRFPPRTDCGDGGFSN